MKNILGIFLLFFIQLFFLHLGVNGTLSKKEKRVKSNKLTLLLKWSGLYICRLEGRKIYKVIILIIYLLFICNITCVCLSIIYEVNIIQAILKISIEISFLLIPLLILINFFFEKK